MPEAAPVIPDSSDHEPWPAAVVELLTPAQRSKILVEWNDTDDPVPDATLPELFERQAARTPGDTAVVFRGRRVSFAELNAQANRLARALVERGAGPEQLVALVLPRSVDLVVSLLAVLKAGAAYLPVDVGYPAERIAYLLADARPTQLLTSTAVAGELPELGKVPSRLLVLDDPAVTDAVAGLPDSDLTAADGRGPLSGLQPAYVIYTSGSTGKPKGVVVCHGGLTNLFHNYQVNIFGPTGRGERLRLLH
nr:AMP-binding protein [Actinomycetota bacterium]